MSHVLTVADVKQLYHHAHVKNDFHLFRPVIAKEYQEMTNVAYLAKLTKKHETLNQKLMEIIELATMVKPKHLKQTWWNTIWTNKHLEATLKMQYVSKRMPQLATHCRQILEEMKKDDIYRGEYSFSFQDKLLDEHIIMLQAFIDIANEHNGTDFNHIVGDWIALKLNFEMTKTQIKLTQSRFDDISHRLQRAEIMIHNYQSFVASYMHQELNNHQELEERYQSIFKTKI